MSPSIPSSLAAVTLGHLNFTANCSNLAIGFNVYINDFAQNNQTAGSGTTGDNGPSGYEDWWTDGVSPEFLGFWRGVLGTALPNTYLKYSDVQIAAWTNHSEFYDFFYDDTLSWPYPDELDELSNSLASMGGCYSNVSLGDSSEISVYSDFQQACMVDYCCSYNITSDQESSLDPFPYYSNWTTQDACSFDLCAQVNQGNPDLGGIGVIVAYILEGTLIFLSLIFFGIKLIADWFYGQPGRQKPRYLVQHEAAMVDAAAVLTDASVFFSFAVNFASVIFNFKDQPQLYEDKLGQTSSLLAIDAPISIVLLSYNFVNRRNLRIAMVFLTTLMTFIIQFLFKKADSFNSGTSLCLAWDDYIQGLFKQRFEAKAVWGSFLTLFVLWAIAHWVLGRCKREKTGMLHKPDRKVSGFFAKAYHKVDWRSIFAYIIAAYGMFAFVIDLRFVLFLRHQEKDVSLDYDEDTWGYGQILAVFVWIPVFIEYVYVFGFQRKYWGARDHNAREIIEERNTYEMAEPDEALVHHDPQAHHPSFSSPPPPEKENKSPFWDATEQHTELAAINDQRRGYEMLQPMEDAHHEGDIEYHSQTAGRWREMGP